MSVKENSGVLELMSYVIGFDLSTQSCSAVLVHSGTFQIQGELSVNFGKDLPAYHSPEGFLPQGKEGEVHADPLMWLDALDLLLKKMKEDQWPLSEVTALSGSGQQHGSIYLGPSFSAVIAELSTETSLSEQLRACLTRKTSPIWMDHSTEKQCEEISSAVGGDLKVCERTGSIMTQRFTGAQIRKFFQEEPEAYQDTAHIHLVSSFFCSLFSGQSAPLDTGDGAGMNLMNLRQQDWDPTLLEATAERLKEKLPPIAPSGTVISKISGYFIEKYGFSPDCQVILWSGDNPCSLVGMGASRPGKMVLSLGTSYTLFSSLKQPLTDPDGFGHVFGNPMGGYMSLSCFMNGSLAREEVRKSKDVNWEHFGTDYLAQTPPGNDGKLMLPFYEPEITPRLHLSEPLTTGWSLAEEQAAVHIRACLEGQFLNMKKHTEWLGESVSELLITGGGSKSVDICQIIADIFQCKVVRMAHAGSAALGAAIMAGVGAGISPIERWEAELCKLDTEKSVTPIPENIQTYTSLMPAFNALYP